MIEGLGLGLLAWLSAMFSWWHLPIWLKRFSIKQFVITDLVVSLSAWLLISSVSHSIVAVVGSIFTGLLMNLTMTAFKKGIIPMPEVKKETTRNVKHNTPRRRAT